MSITQSSQQALTRSGTDTGHDIVYLLQSNSSDIDDQVADVVGWITNSLPATYLGQSGSSVNYQEIGSGWWSVTARYSNDESQTKGNPPEIDDESDWRFSIATESRTLKRSKGLYAVVPDTGLWGDYFGKPFPLNFDGKDVNGVDVQVPVASWQETYYFDPTDVDQTYRLNCLSLVGKVNNGTFRGASARQVMLQSVEGNKKAATPWIVTFTFLYRPDYSATVRFSDGENRLVTTIGFQIADVRDGRGNVDGITTAVPKRIFIQDVYELGDFSLLGIGS